MMDLRMTTNMSSLSGKQIIRIYLGLVTLLVLLSLIKNLNQGDLYERSSSRNLKSLERKAQTYTSHGNFTMGTRPVKITTKVQHFQEEKQHIEKKILIWSSHGSWNKHDWRKLFSRQFDKQCPQNCKIVFERRNRKSADAIVFREARGVRLPSIHPKNQMWVLFNIEAPTHFSWNFFNKSKGVFDWTMTYHTESDIVTPYGRVLRREQETTDLGENKYRDYWAEKQKEKFASWLVSKCATPSKREDYVREFQKYESVDIYGRCGPLKCGTRTILPNVGTMTKENKCYELMSSYMFYFAFENSLCNDYITEKFFRALQLDAIPVVYGGGNYSSIAPRHSFINARDFESPQELASYLRKVADDAQLYNSYFEWRNEFVVESGFPFSPFVCDLCSKLHQAPMQFSKERNSAARTSEGRYADLIDWFIGLSKCEGGKYFVYN